MKTLINSKMWVERGMTVGEDAVDCSQEVDIEGYVEYTVDNQYGADADGNRGTSRTTVQEVEDITAYDIDGNDFQLTKKEIEQASQELTQKFLEG